MTPASAAAPSRAVVCFARTATGRRGLRVALVLGGLFVLLALGFLFGERAQAVEGVPSRPLERVPSARSAEPVPAVQQPGGGAEAEAEVEAAGRHVEPVLERAAAGTQPGVGTAPVVQPEAPRAGLPVDEVVDDVTGALRETPPPARWVPGPPLRDAAAAGFRRRGGPRPRCRHRSRSQARTHAHAPS